MNPPIMPPESGIDNINKTYDTKKYGFNRKFLDFVYRNKNYRYNMNQYNWVSKYESICSIDLVSNATRYVGLEEDIAGQTYVKDEEKVKVGVTEELVYKPMDPEDVEE